MELAIYGINPHRGIDFGSLVVICYMTNLSVNLTEKLKMKVSEDSEELYENVKIYLMVQI